jgi:hypothetical protein
MVMTRRVWSRRALVGPRKLVNDRELLVEYRKNHANYSIAARPKPQVVERLADDGIGLCRISSRPTVQSRR